MESSKKFFVSLSLLSYLPVVLLVIMKVKWQKKMTASNEVDSLMRRLRTRVGDAVSVTDGARFHRFITRDSA